MAIWAMIWSVAVVVEVALHILVPRSALRAVDLPAGARFLLLCYSLTVLTVFSALLGAVIKYAGATLSRLPAHLGAPWFGRGCTVLLVWLVSVLYGASWGLFWQTGSFIDSQVFVFLAPHPLQVIHWVDLDVALIIIAAAGAVTFVIVEWVPRWMARQSLAFHQTIIRIWTRLIGLCLSGALLGQLYSTWDERQYTRSGLVYLRNQENDSGPFAYVVSDFKKYFTIDIHKI